MIIAGNWKMNLNGTDAVALAKACDEWCAMHPPTPKQVEMPQQVEMIIFPPAVLIPLVRDALSRDTRLHLGGQDCHPQSHGAHTGDIAAKMLADAGCRWVLAGHSERRHNHGEDNALVAAKARQACSSGLKPIICVGEVLADRRSGVALDVVAKQVRESLPDAAVRGADEGASGATGGATDEASGGAFIEASIGAPIGAIAYEPVWAIGTGEVASIDDIAEMHALIREVLAAHLPVGDTIPVLYGGSVKPENAAAILGLDGVAGVLVGGASLLREDFLAIATASASVANAAG